MKRLALTLIAGVSLLAPAATAGADGLPLPVDGADDASVTNPGGAYRYGAVATGGTTTLLKIVTDGGRIFRTRTFSGEFGVPIVAYDGTASGLSADGTTLALIQPRRTFPREATNFMVFDTATLKPRESIHLRGDFSFDAISPDGSRLYLVHYRGGNPLDYEVRAYDVERGRLLPEPIVDPDEPDEQMAGFPITRMTSPDGRWAYTLYGGGHETFIHALDTHGLTAQCIDLEDVNPGNIYRLDLNVDPASGELTVLERGDPAAIVDPRTFEVSDPPTPEVADTTAAPDDDSGGIAWVGWAAVGGGLVLIGALGVLLWRRRRPEDDLDEEALERLVRIDADAREAEEAEETEEAQREPVR